MDRSEIENALGVPFDQAGTKLDEKLQVVSKGRVQVCIALVVSLHFVDLPTDEARERVAKVVDLYANAAGDRLIWGADPKTRRPRKIAGTDILNVRNWMNRLRTQDDFEPVFTGGQNSKDASPYTFMAQARATRRAGFAAVYFSLPFEWAVRQAPGTFRKLTSDACSALRATQGCAGFGLVVPPSEYGGGEPMAFAAPLAARFRGLEFQTSFLLATELGMAGLIKGVNWLTVLGDPFVAKLGGLSTIVAALGEGIDMMSYDGGLIVQAGPAPRMGDVNKGRRLEEYERVAAVVKPIRATETQPFAWNHGFDQDRTAEWLARFDK